MTWEVQKFTWNHQGNKVEKQEEKGEKAVGKIESLRRLAYLVDGSKQQRLNRGASRLKMARKIVLETNTVLVLKQKLNNKTTKK